MPSLSLAKKTIAAAALIAPLSMSVVSCSSNGDDAADATSTTSTSASTSTLTSTETSTSTTSSTTTTASGETLMSETTSAPAPAPVPDQEAAAAVAAAAANLPSPKPASPVQGGRPATPEEARAIEDLARRVAWAPTLRGYLGGILDNTCNSVLQANGGREAYDLNQIPDVPMDMIPELQGRRAEVQSVTDIMVEGNTASATVTANAGNEVETGTMRFLKEDGVWKLCD
ncbi:hypothetical protein JIM95_002295 [Corynebacterium sp. CCM 8835]|uniref:Secreted protein n=1 Tax=Corynebacterium antarcticum TaxID=2800405 RepID=A0A9Q4CAY4_9CORY|nr:hypothetical protein [Corynebacterium antarcticum]MCL0244984.1 hypothetical protein [Corynebacterium antarcticum]MCX7491357.1 hypothetical protein [Corynebacterium antarcticum]MCX7537376.1 hypothetical protein [Corynebacterium antarcticum]MCX7539464.1 hypothetical protein [Corynebacterium antarcticum]